MNAANSSDEEYYDGRYAAELFARLTNAGIVTSSLVAKDSFSMTLTEKGKKIISSFRELEATAGPFSDGDVNLLWFLFVKGQIQPGQ